MTGVASAARLDTTQAAKRKQLKIDFVDELACKGGDTKDPSVASLLRDLGKASPSHGDGLLQVKLACGQWELVSKADFPDCEGANAAGDPLYTLGRMSFGMLAPSDLLCSIQSITNTITESTAGASGNHKHTYEVAVAFTLEEGGSTRGLEGVLTTRGALAPARRGGTGGRFEVEFTEGFAFPRNPSNELDASLWRSVFSTATSDGGSKPLRRSHRDRLALFLARLFMGARPSRGIEEDQARVEAAKPKDKKGGPSLGHALGLRFQLKRPKPGFLEIIYLDSDLRVTRGNRGSITVLRRRQWERPGAGAVGLA